MVFFAKPILAKRRRGAIAFYESFHLIDHTRRADGDSGALVQMFCGQIQDALELAGDRFATGLFNDKRKGIALVNEAELTLRIFSGIGIEEDAAIQKDTVNIGHHRTDIAQAQVHI